MCQKYELEERDKYMRQRHEKIYNAQSKLLNTQTKELNLTKKRLEERLNKELKNREIQHNECL